MMILFQRFGECRNPDAFTVFVAHALIDERPGRPQLETLLQMFKKEDKLGSSIRTRIESFLG